MLPDLPGSCATTIFLEVSRTEGIDSVANPNADTFPLIIFRSGPFSDPVRTQEEKAMTHHLPATILRLPRDVGTL
jgi:hypothetical protein